MIKQILDSLKPKMEKTIEHLKDELKTIRTGRAAPSLIEEIPVSYYGSKVPLKQVATINIPNPRVIVIQPWDKDSLVDIQSAISENSVLGATPNNDGKVIRLNIPALSEEQREEFIKVVHKKIEEARISLRNIRHEVKEEIRHNENKGDISEDDMYKGEEELQKNINEYMKKIDEISSQKEKEIREI